MITKERLEELIEQKKSIYWKFAKIKPSSWSKYTIMGNTIVKGNLKEIYSIDDLFETKEEAEWHKEFGCIERTERLELPTWEEVYETANRNIFYFEKGIIGKINGTRYPNFDEREIEIKNIYLDNILFKKPLTKDNYTLACRKCKELFLGKDS